MRQKWKGAAIGLILLGLVIGNLRHSSSPSFVVDQWDTEAERPTTNVMAREHSIHQNRHHGHPLNDNSTVPAPNNKVLSIITNPPLPLVRVDPERSQLALIQPATPALEAHFRNLSMQPVTSTTPWPNLTTNAYYEGRIYSGFRNQMMIVSVVVFQTIVAGHGQLLLPSLGQKDTYGSNKFIPFSKLWDVPHWNSFYPHLPRLVDYDPILHDQFAPHKKPPWYRDSNHSKFLTAAGVSLVMSDEGPVRPFSFGRHGQCMAMYVRYAKGNGPYAVQGHRNAAEQRMLQGALRPHPDLQAILDRQLEILARTIQDGNNREGRGSGYMTLHARVEPDMQVHPVCRDKKVLNLTDIFDFLEDQWPNGPPSISTIFMPINRQYLEQEGTPKKRKRINWIAVENLRALNRAREVGLWNGTVSVVEFGANVLVNTTYAHRPSTTGALLNFFIGVNADIFVGTEVSSFSHDLLATRFYRGHPTNYKYLPQGLVPWTPRGTQDPPGFLC